MGQAKQRGSFEARRIEAVLKIEAERVRKAALPKARNSYKVSNKLMLFAGITAMATTLNSNRF